MIKRIETENEKEQVYELICLEVQEELIYKKQPLPNKEFVFETFEDKNEVYFIDVEQNIVNGYIKTHISNYFDEIWIYGLYVRKNKRNNGIAKSLLDEIFNFAKTNQKQTIKLYAYSNNLPAIKLYEKYGFIETQKLMTKEL